MHVSVCVSVFVFAGYIFRSGIAGSYFQLEIWKLLYQFPSILFSMYHFTIPPRVCECSFFSTYAPYAIYRYFDNSHSERCEVILQCGFNLHFSIDLQCRVSYKTVNHLYAFIGNISSQIF